MNFAKRDFIIILFLIILFPRYGIILAVIYWLIKSNWPKIEIWIKQKKAFTIPSEPLQKAKASIPSFKLPTMNFPTFKISIAFVFTLAVILIFLDGFTSIPAGHVGVVYDRGRGVLEESFTEGLHLKLPFWQVVTKMDTRLQAYTMSIAPEEGQNFGDDSIESLTKDGQKVFVDMTIQFRIAGDEAPWIFQNIGLDYSDKVIRPGVRNVVRDIITGYDSTQLFTQETRTEAQQKMEEALTALYAKNNITLDKLLLRNIQFSEVYLQAIEDKQVAQQRIQKAEYERQEAEKAKETKIIEAQAEAEAIRLKGETLRANPQVIQFEFVQKMADDINWGVLPNDILPLIDLQRFNQ